MAKYKISLQDKSYDLEGNISFSMSSSVKEQLYANVPYKKFLLECKLEDDPTCKTRTLMEDIYNKSFADLQAAQATDLSFHAKIELIQSEKTLVLFDHIINNLMYNICNTVQIGETEPCPEALLIFSYAIG